MTDQAGIGLVGSHMIGAERVPLVADPFIQQRVLPPTAGDLNDDARHGDTQDDSDE